jgi:hypothetical protein
MKALFLLYIIVPASFIIVVVLQPKKPVVADVRNRAHYCDFQTSQLLTPFCFRRASTDEGARWRILQNQPRAPESAASVASLHMHRSMERHLLRDDVFLPLQHALAARVAFRLRGAGNFRNANFLLTLHDIPIPLCPSHRMGVECVGHLAVPRVRERPVSPLRSAVLHTCVVVAVCDLDHVRRLPILIHRYQCALHQLDVRRQLLVADGPRLDRFVFKPIAPTFPSNN